MNKEHKKTAPKQVLSLIKQEKKGHLKIFLGYAPGVGKTYSMLNEANRRLKRNHDIVIGYLETHGRKETENQIGSLRMIPRKIIYYNGITAEEMDTDAIITRHPDVVLVDELAHMNVPGSKYRKRYEDVLEILDNGIDVLTTLNVQHLESLNDIVKDITGINVGETIPDIIVENADEIMIVDITPDALQNRLKRGTIYKQENVDRSLMNFFRKGNLNALREIALRQTAEEVDEELIQYMEEHDILETWHTNERVMVCVTSNPYAKKLIRRGTRIAKRYKCEWLVVNVDCTHIFAPKLTDKDRATIHNHLKLASQLGAEVMQLKGKSISEELVKFATDRHITQIIIGHSNRTHLQTVLRGSTVNKLLKKIENIEVHVIPDDYYK